MRYAVSYDVIIIQDNSFNENFFNTIGVDFKIKNVSLDNQNIKL